MRARWLIAGLATAAFAGVFATSAAASPSGPLGHAGRWITDAQGRVVTLHGFNMVYKRAPYYSAAIGFGDDDAAFLQSEGYDTVRLGVIYKAVEPQPGVYDDAYLNHIADTVATLGRHGIYALLDFHQDLFNERFQGEGWPDWAVQDDGLPAQPQAGFPGNYPGMPALQHAFDHFWNNDPGPGGVGLQDRYAAAWRHVAQRFGGDPHVLGYDLLNEPWPGTVWQDCANTAGCARFDAIMTAFIKRTVKAIRTVDPSRLVFYEPNVLFDFGADTNVGDVGDPRAVFSFHDYCLAAGSSMSNAGCDPAEDLPFANALKHSRSSGDALLLTEFDATSAPDIISSMLARADRNMVGWQEWHYCGCDDPTTTGSGDTQAIVLDPAKPPAGANLVAAKLALLSRPYPEVLAGTPRSFFFDPATKEFRVAYSTDAAAGGAFADGAESQIVLPARQYPNGYGADAQGAAIESAPGAQLLRLAACPGARSVSLRVTAPGGGARGSCSVAVARTARRIRLTVSPRTLVAGRRVRLHFRARYSVRGRLRALRGARIRFAGRAVRTNRRGRATMSRRLSAPRVYRARATHRGLLAGRTNVRVLPHR